MMPNMNYLTGIVMLETMWSSRQSDLLDLIAPFIYYEMARITSPGQVIDVRRVRDAVIANYGYNDIPQSVITKVFARKPNWFRKKNGHFILSVAIDNEVAQFEKRKEEGEKKINEIGQQIADYFSTHLRRKRSYSRDAAITALQSFFSRYGVYVGTNQLEEQKLSPKEQEEDYYIAQFIFEKKRAFAVEYDDILDLVKGYFLQSAIYLQAENGSIFSATFKDVTFYYDTPFLLRLLGWRSEEDKETTNELHKALSDRKGTFAYFPQTEREIENVLGAYQHSIGRPSYVTLEALDEQGYSKSDVERLKATWETNLKTKYNINLVSLPPYAVKNNSSIDEELVLNEAEVEQYLQQNMRWRSTDSTEADIASALAIHRLRDGLTYAELERCKCVFVTTNVSLARHFNRYYRENVDSRPFPLLITDTDLAALTWIKCGASFSLPEKQLLRNAYMAMQPTSEMLDKFTNVLIKMEREGSVTPEMITVLRANRYIKKEIMFASFEEGEGITENVIQKAMKKIQEDLSADMKADAERERDEEHHRRLEKADNQARTEARTVSTKLLSILRGTATVFECAIMLFAIIETVKSWSNITVSVFFIAFALVCIFSVIDTTRGREKFIDKGIVRLTNRIETFIYEKKKEKYSNIAS